METKELVKAETTAASVAVKEEAKELKKEVLYFVCSSCSLRERYDSYGSAPTFVRKYRLLEEAYVIENPFMPPKQGEFIVLGAHCMKCNNCVCKDMHCSFYYDGTYCITCAKNAIKTFPENVQQKLNRIIST